MYIHVLSNFISNVLSYQIYIKLRRSLASKDPWNLGGTSLFKKKWGLHSHWCQFRVDRWSSYSSLSTGIMFSLTTLYRCWLGRFAALSVLGWIAGTRISTISSSHSMVNLSDPAIFKIGTVSSHVRAKVWIRDLLARHIFLNPFRPNILGDPPRRLRDFPWVRDILQENQHIFRGKIHGFWFWFSLFETNLFTTGSFSSRYI